MNYQRSRIGAGLILLPVVSLTIPFLQVSPARAADCDVTNSTTLGSTLSGGSGQNICNIAPGSIITSGFNAIGAITFSGGNISNTGSITTSGGNAFGTYANGGGDVDNSGSITTSGSSAFGVYTTGGGAVDNSGSIATTGDFARGVNATGGGNVTNSGSISTIGSNAFGAYANGGGDVDNSGSIITSGESAWGASAEGGGNVTNSGSITTSGEVAFGAYANGGGDITNTGSIFTSGSSAFGVYGIGTGSNTVYNSGTITSTNASAVHLASGNDTLILAENGVVNGLMNGGADTDTLVFSLNVEDQYYDQISAELDALIAGGSATGTIVINGNTYNWISFEILSNDLKRLIRTNRMARFMDNRLNPWDFQQTVTGYCLDGDTGGFAFYSISANSQGDALLNVTNAQVNTALEQAAASGSPVMLGEKDGKSVWALPSHELQMHDGTPGGTYNYIWMPEVCGSYQP